VWFTGETINVRSGSELSHPDFPQLFASAGIVLKYKRQRLYICGHMLAGSYEHN